MSLQKGLCEASLIDQKYKSAVLEVMHAVGKKPSVEKWTAVDDDWFDPPIGEE